MDSYFGGSTTIAESTPIEITSADRSAIDISLTLGGAISGRVTAVENGSPLFDIDIDVYDAAGAPVDVNARTDSNGDYLIGAMAPAQYFRRVDPTIAQDRPRVYFPQALSTSTATPITVVASTVTQNIDFSLSTASVISGRITRSKDASAAAGIDLDCFTLAGDRVDLTTLNDANGNSSRGPLAPGSYILRADPTIEQAHARVYHPNAFAPSGAIAVVVPLGGEATGVDIDVYDGTNSRTKLNSSSDIFGTFLIGPVPPGEYKLRADPSIAQVFAVEYWDAQVNLETADVLTVSAGAETGGIVLRLDGGGSLSGTVTAADTGKPQAGVDMDVFDAVTGIRLDQSALNDEAGFFRLGPLPVGAYHVRADTPTASFYEDRYYGDSATRAGAAVATVLVGQETTMVNIQGLRLREATPGFCTNHRP